MTQRQKPKVNEMNYFANLKNGVITINTYRFPGAQVTDINDILSALENDSEETLAASIDNDVELAAISKYQSN